MGLGGRLQEESAPVHTSPARMASACAPSASADHGLRSRLPGAACLACFAAQQVGLWPATTIRHAAPAAGSTKVLGTGCVTHISLTLCMCFSLCPMLLQKEVHFAMFKTQKDIGYKCIWCQSGMQLCLLLRQHGRQLCNRWFNTVQRNTLIHTSLV